MKTKDQTKHIDAKEVHAILIDCLYRDSEIIDGKPSPDPIISEGILQPFGLHPERIASHAQRIHEILLALPEPFREDKGGGWSFLNACNDANGDQWGEHISMNALFVLGMAAGKCRLVVPREMWSVLPGEMPYYAVATPAEVVV